MLFNILNLLPCLMALLALDSPGDQVANIFQLFLQLTIWPRQAVAYGLGGSASQVILRRGREGRSEGDPRVH